MNNKAGILKTNHRVLDTTGLRITNQRRLLLEIIRQEEEHLDAVELYRRARERQPRLSLSTVYRALQKFKRLGLVDEVHFDEAHHHYEVKPSAEHHHLVCLGCDRVIEFRYLLSRYIKKHVPEAENFDITETEIRLTGYCSQCRRRRK